MIDDDLSGFLADTRRHLDRELAAVAPDLAASVARARELDPQAVSARAVEETAALAPVAQLRPRQQLREADRSALAPFTADLRDRLEADLARQIHRGAIASASAPVAALPTGRRTLVFAALALAAAVLLAFGLRGALEARDARPGAIPGAAALAGSRSAAAPVEHRDPSRRAAVLEDSSPVPEDILPEPVPEDTLPVPEDILPVPEDILPVPVPEVPVPEDSAAPAERPRPRRPTREPAPAVEPPPGAPEPPTAEDPLAALDREAQALWQAGDLRGAADKFAEIVRRAPASRAAEAAYGDLFALEHRLGGDPVELWRAYLRQFPRGRYADDARAGICRREPAAERPTCWRDYLSERPDGAHRREAEQATAP